jgi:hypothetical protein
MSGKRGKTKLTAKQVFYMTCVIISMVIAVLAFGGTAAMFDRFVRASDYYCCWYVESFGDLKWQSAIFDEDGEFTGEFFMSDEQIFEKMQLDHESHVQMREAETKFLRDEAFHGLTFIVPVFGISSLLFLYFNAKLEERGWVSKRLKRLKK